MTVASSVFRTWHCFCPFSRTYVPTQAKEAEWAALTASVEAAKAEAASLEAQNQRLGDELDRLAATSGSSKSKPTKDMVSAADLAAAVKA